MIFPLQYRIFSNCTNLTLEDGLTIHFEHRIQQEGEKEEIECTGKRKNLSIFQQRGRGLKASWKGDCVHTVGLFMDGATHNHLFPLFNHTLHKEKM